MYTLAVMINLCKACGTELQTSEVQMRSADEAHTVITSCPSCPVDINKVSSTRRPSNPLIGMRRNVHRPASHAPRRSSGSKNIYLLIADIPDTHKFMDIDLSEHYITVSTPFYSSVGSNLNLISAAYTVVNGMFKGMCINYKCSQSIALGIGVDTYEMLRIDNAVDGRECIIKGSYKIDTSLSIKYDCYIYSDYNSKSRKYIVELMHTNPSVNVLSDLVNTLYSNGLIPRNMERYIDNDTIAKFGNLSPRGWDASTAPTTDHMFTCKPDGQNTWLLWIGHVWYKFNPRCRGGIKSWIWTNTLNDKNIVAINVEDMMMYGCIVIDCFTDEKGNVVGSSRDLKQVIAIANKIIELCSEIPLVIREYFDNYELAVKYSNTLEYPIDGVVAIRNDSTEILKIKPIKSMELLLNEHNILTTSDGTPVFECPEHISRKYDKDTILEVRFEVRDQDTISITDVFPRTDKTVANSHTAVSNIIRSAYKVLTPADNERRIALLWCNDLRKCIYDKAYNIASNNSIIIDIGTGTGQSLDSLSASKNVSYIYIEPDKDRCKSIARRLGIKKIVENPNDILASMKPLKIRSLKHVILNCPISTVLSNHRVSESMFSEAKCIICTFSMQFIVKELNYISSTFNVPILGCGYTYDNMTASGVLINKCDVVMKRQSDTEASVKWGGDKKYTEPITMQKDYVGIGNVIAGSQLVALPDINLSSDAHNICRNVTVILPSN